MNRLTALVLLWNENGDFSENFGRKVGSIAPLTPPPLFWPHSSYVYGQIHTNMYLITWHLTRVFTHLTFLFGIATVHVTRRFSTQSPIRPTPTANTHYWIASPSEFCLQQPRARSVSWLSHWPWNIAAFRITMDKTEEFKRHPWTSLLSQWTCCLHPGHICTGQWDWMFYRLRFTRPLWRKLQLRSWTVSSGLNMWTKDARPRIYVIGLLWAVSTESWYAIEKKSWTEYVHGFYSVHEIRKKCIICPWIHGFKRTVTP